jgi:HK97 family phage major capsid protein
VGKIANAMTISDEAVADAPTLYQFIQSRLLFLLQRQEEVQILAASGYPGVGGLLSFASNYTVSTSNSYYGATSGTGTNVAFPPAGTNGAGVLSQSLATLPYGRSVGGNGLYPAPIFSALQLKDAFVDIELAVFHSPTAVVMHPRDWQILEVAQDANGQFMNGSFFGSNYGVKTTPVKSIWNVPVVTTPLIPKGVMLTGWFDPQTVQIARRQGISMQMTNSNGTDFVQGNITMRAEERLGLLCYRPQAFQLINLHT